MFQSLKSRLELLLVLVALPGIAVIYLHADKERQYVIENIRFKTAEATRQIAFTQKKIVRNTQIYLKNLAVAPPIQDPASPQCGQFLRTVHPLNGAYVNVGVPLANGDLLCNALPLTRKINVFDRGYFQQSLRQRNFAIGTFQHDRAADKISVNFSYPVISKRTNDVVGLVVAVVSLDWWSEQLAEFDLPEDSVALISDVEGTIVASYPKREGTLGDRVDRFGVVEPIQILPDFYSKAVTGQDGITRIFTHATLFHKDQGKGFLVSVGLPVDQAVHLANQTFIVTLAIFALTMMLVAALAIRGLHKSILTPLNRLTAATASLAKGRFTESPLEPGARELVVLQQRFQDMAITRLEAEQTANRRSEELNSVFSALPDLYFRLDKHGVILEYKASNQSELYVPPDQFLGKKVVDIVPHDVGELFQEKLREHNHTMGRITWEYSLCIAGQQQFFEARLNTIQHTDELIIVVRNITERRNAEESMKLAALVYQNSSEGMAITDADGHILNINLAFTDVTGYSLEEVQARNISVLRSGHHDTDFYTSLWTKLNTEGRWQGEIYNSRKNGTICPYWLTIDTVYNELHQPYRRIALYRDISEQKKAEEMIWQQANFDALTELPNRNMLYDRLSQEIKKSQRSNLPLAVFFLDLDQFKEVNDTLGHTIGDELLKKAAYRLSRCVRAGDTVARQGGDEFTIIVTELHDPTSTEVIAEKILHELAKPFVMGNEIAYITASIGISIYPTDAVQIDDLLKAADQAMYASKKLGRNRYHFFTASMQAAAVSRIQLINDLHEAEERNQFRLFYQPIVSLKSARIIKAEALLRWQHPQRGLVSPAEFIPIAEETHQITAIGNWVFQEAVNQITRLRSIFDSSFQVSVNVSPIQFASINSELKQWLPRMEALGLGGDAIVAEITEGVMMDASEETASRLIAFGKAGIQVALDDFGTGYSSLSYILEYDIDYIKIAVYNGFC